MTRPLAKLLVAAISMLTVAPAFAGQPPVWVHTDYVQAVALAKSQNKHILLDFTGSDWCPECSRMKWGTLNKPEFQSYAEPNLVIVELDFPRNNKQTPELKRQNKQLDKQYGHPNGFPTLILTDTDGKELGRHVGFLKAEPLIAELNTFYKPISVPVPAVTAVQAK